METTTDIPSDSDDSIIFIPYVKPQPPTLTIDDDPDQEVISYDDDGKEETTGPSNKQNSHPFFSSSNTNSDSYPVITLDKDSAVTSNTSTREVTPNSSLYSSDSSSISKHNNNPTNESRNEVSSSINVKNQTPSKNNKKDTVKSKTNNDNDGDSKSFTIDRRGSSSFTFPYELTDSERKKELLYEKIVNIVQKEKLEKRALLDRVNKSKQACMEQVKLNQTTPTTTNSQQQTQVEPFDPRLESPAQKNSCAKLLSPQKRSLQQQSPSPSPTTSPTKKPAKKRQRKETSASLLNADLDHFNFLKTLNLTANIGLDEQEILALGRTRPPRRKRSKTSSSSSSTASSKKEQQLQQVTGEPVLIQDLTSPGLTTQNLDLTQKQSQSSSSSTSIILDEINEPENNKSPSIINSIPSTLSSSSSNNMEIRKNNNKTKNNVDDTPIIPFVSIVDESVGKTSSVSKRKRSFKSQSSPSPVFSISPSSTPSPAATTTTTTTTYSAPVIVGSTPIRGGTREINKKTVTDRNEEIVTVSSDSSGDEEEQHGIFTRAELDKVQSNIHLNISGGSVGKSFNSTDTRKNKNREIINKSRPKKSFRYFQMGSKSTEQEDEEEDDDDDDDDEKLSGSDRDSDSENPSLSPSCELTLSKRTTSKTRFIKTKLKELKRKSNMMSPEKQRSKVQQQKAKRTKFDDDFVPSETMLNFSASDDEDSSSICSLSYENHSKTTTSLELENENSTCDTRSFPSTWTKSMQEFYDKIRHENWDIDDALSTQSDYRGLWATPLDPDFSSNYRGRRIRCNNCQQPGHIQARCPEPVKVKRCLMCGQEGHTTPCFYSSDDRSSQMNRSTVTRCPKANCLNCGRSSVNRKQNYGSSKYVQSCENCTVPSYNSKNSKRCRLCGIQGHFSHVCPDNWRRFHSTTTVNNMKEDIFKTQNDSSTQDELQKTQYKIRSQQYCSNCGGTNHFYFNCGGRRDFNSYMPTSPYVVNEVRLPTITAVTTPSMSARNSYSSKESEATVAETTETMVTSTTETDEEELMSTLTKTVVVESQNMSRNSNTSSSNNKPATTTTSSKFDSSVSIDLLCSAFPDCQNSNATGVACHSIGLSKEEYQLVTRVNKDVNIIQRLKEECRASHIQVDICLLEKASSFHLCGNYDDLRDKIFQLLYRLKTDGVDNYIKSISKQNQGDVTHNGGRQSEKTSSFVSDSKSKPETPSSSLLPPDGSPSANNILTSTVSSLPNNKESDETRTTISGDKPVLTENLNKEPANNNNSSDITLHPDMFIEDEAELVMMRKITITNELAVAPPQVTEQKERESKSNCDETSSGEVTTFLTSSEDAISFEQDQLAAAIVSTGVDITHSTVLKPTTPATLRTEVQPVEQSSPSTSASSSNNANNNRRNISVSEEHTSVPMNDFGSSHSSTREFPEIIQIDDDDDDDDDDVVVQEVIKSKSPSNLPQRSNNSIGISRSVSPKRREKVNNNNNNKGRKSLEDLSPSVTIELTPAEWVTLLPPHARASTSDSIAFLNGVRDEFNVCILAEKDKLKITITNNKWTILLNAKFKITQWLLRKTYNNTTNNINSEKREQKYNNNNNNNNNNNRHHSRSPRKSQERSQSSSSSSSSKGNSFNKTQNRPNTSNNNNNNYTNNKWRESSTSSSNHNPRNFQHGMSNQQVSRGRGNFHFRGPRSFKNTNANNGRN